MIDIFAHRGWVEECPENSRIAIRTAFERGVGVELDVRLNQDDDFVLTHDKNLERMFAKNIDVSKIRNKELSQYTYRNFSNEKLCRFYDVAQEFPDSIHQQTAIHLKAEDQTERGIALLAHYFELLDLFNKAFVFDLTAESAKRLRKINKKIRIAFIVSEYKFEPTVYTWEDVKNMSELYDIVWAAEYRNLYSKEFVSTVKKIGKIFYAVSPDVHKPLNHPLANGGFEKMWSDLISWGVDGICTDYSSRLLLLEKDTGH